jgi:di/tricarboxylate transporter
MTFTMGLVLVVIALMLAALVVEVAAPAMIVLIALIIFMVTGVVNVSEALSGFSNSGLMTIALLFIISDAIQKSGYFSYFMRYLMGKRAMGRWSLLRMMIPTSIISAFLNNTPIVVAFTPYVRKWCQEHNMAPSKFLIPLSYATILGGMVTLMGTSTNLVIHGMLIQHHYQGFSMFQLAVVGVPAVIIGWIYLTFFGYRLLPEHTSEQENTHFNVRDYLAECVVGERYPFINNTIAQAGLRKLNGLFLIEIIRGEERIYPVKATTVIRKDDRLVFTGDVSTIAELQNTKGLDIEPFATSTVDEWIDERKSLVEAIVSHHSTLIGQQINKSHFRSRFDAAIIAVHRHHERIKGKVGEIVLKPGDTLLLLTGTDFMRKQGLDSDFYVVTPIDNPFITKKHKRHGLWILATMIPMIGMVTAHILSMFLAMSLEVALLFILRVITFEDVKKSLPIDVLLLVGSAFGIGIALTNSGLADYISTGVIKMGEPLGILAILFLVYLLTNILTEFITNNAAAVIMFPIALSTAERFHMSPTPFVVLLAIAASASFITPIGYQTNLIVYGPGGYRFTDYIKVGLPLSIMLMLLSVIIVYFVWV